MSKAKYVQISFVFILKIIASLSSVLMGVIVTRIYGLEMMGMYTVVLTIINISVLIGSWGLGNSYISSFYDDGGSGNILAILIVNLVLSVAILPLVLFSGKWLGVGELTPMLCAFIVFSLLTTKSSFLAVKNLQVLNSL